MTKRALSALAGFLGCCLSLSAQPTSPGLDPLDFDGSTLPSLTLADRDFFSFSTAFGWTPTTTTNFLPAFSPMEPRSAVYPTTPSRRNSVDNPVELRATDRIHFGGEVGFLYGRSDGKYGREDFLTYITGTVGNEKFSITAGYLHLESSGRALRWRR
jgi:hypothetical protein